MLVAAGVRADDQKPIPGPIDSLGDLQDTGKLLFKLVDTNNDNRISPKEAIDAGDLLAGGYFFRADTNGDGTVTADEFRVASEDMFNQKPLLRFIVQRAQEQASREGTQGQINQGKQTIMIVLDTNHDGNVSSQELRQAVQTGVQSIFLMADKNADGQLDPAEVNQGIGEAGRAVVQTAFNMADTDKNGAVSQAEFDKAIMSPAHMLFHIMDANNDNQISPDEMRSGAQILARELQALRVPEPANSLSNQLNRQGATLAPGALPAGTTNVIPAQPVRPAIAPGAAPVVVNPPHR
jgi:Ca2+-binding EF-hand superfamily protein